MNGLLAVWNDCDSEALERYEHWYQGEHLPDRVGVPGFHNGVRHEAAAANPALASPRFFTSYDLDDVAVLDSAVYQQMLRSPSLQTQAIMPHFRNMWRFVGRLIAHEGRCGGAWTVTIRLGQLQGAAQSRRADLQAWVERLRAVPPGGACRWRLYESALASAEAGAGLPAAAPSPEARFRAGSDSVSHGVLLIEHLRRDDAGRTVNDWLGAPGVAALLDPQDRIDQFLEMSRLDSRSMHR
jgi:hypothetical protein